MDETYIGGQWKNKRHSTKGGCSKRGRVTSKTPVFGILCRGGKVWAQVVSDVEAKTLLPLITRWVELGSTVCSDTWKSYTGVAANGYVHMYGRQVHLFQVESYLIEKESSYDIKEIYHYSI